MLAGTAAVNPAANAQRASALGSSPPRAPRPAPLHGRRQRSGVSSRDAGRRAALERSPALRTAAGSVLEVIAPVVGKK